MTKVSEAYYYRNLFYDLSGSRSKNRFRNDILWGLKKILTYLYKADVEFTVVFEYVCDIEVHSDRDFEFYQVKTQNNDEAYTIEELLKKSNKGESVFNLV